LTQNKFADPRMSSVTRIVAIDPGSTGAIVLLDEGRISRIESMPMGKIYGPTKKVWFPELLTMIDNMDPNLIVVEKVNATKNQGTTNSGAFMFGFAMNLAVGPAAGIPVFLLNSAEWKSYWGLSKSKKSQSTKKARAVFADQSTFVNKHFKNLSSDHDKAEACLMARYFWDIKRFTRNMEEDRLW